MLNEQHREYLRFRTSLLLMREQKLNAAVDVRCPIWFQIPSDDASTHTCLMLPYIACLCIQNTLREPKLGIRLNYNYHRSMNIIRLHSHTHTHTVPLCLVANHGGFEPSQNKLVWSQYKALLYQYILFQLKMWKRLKVISAESATENEKRLAGIRQEKGKEHNLFLTTGAQTNWTSARE